MNTVTTMVGLEVIMHPMPDGWLDIARDAQGLAEPYLFTHHNPNTGEEAMGLAFVGDETARSGAYNSATVVCELEGTTEKARLGVLATAVSTLAVAREIIIVRGNMLSLNERTWAFDKAGLKPRDTHGRPYQDIIEERAAACTGDDLSADWSGISRHELALRTAMTAAGITPPLHVPSRARPIASSPSTAASFYAA